MAEIYDSFEAVGDAERKRKQRENLAKSFSAAAAEDEDEEEDDEEIGKVQTGTAEKGLTDEGIPGAEAIGLETKSHNDSYQPTELFDIGRTFAVKMEDGSDEELLIASIDVKQNPFCNERGAVKDLTQRADGTLWAQPEAMEDVVLNGGGGDYRVYEDKGGDRYLRPADSPSIPE